MALEDSSPLVPNTDHGTGNVSEILNRVYNLARNALRVTIGPGALPTLTVRKNISFAGKNIILAGKAGVRYRIISYTISVSGTAEEAELYFGEYNETNIVDGGYFGANGGVHSDCGSAGNGSQGEAGENINVNLAAGEDVKVCIVYSEE